jgi:hypothetical protein
MCIIEYILVYLYQIELTIEILIWTHLAVLKKTRIKWKLNKVNDFIQVLTDDHNDVLVNINNVLDEFDNGTLVSKPKVSGLVNDLCNFICNTASTVFGTNNKNRHHNKNNSKRL